MTRTAAAPTSTSGHCNRMAHPPARRRLTVVTHMEERRRCAALKRYFGAEGGGPAKPGAHPDGGVRPEKSRAKPLTETPI